MKALVCEKFGEIDELVFKELDIPKLKEYELLVKVHAAALNFPDILTIQGKAQYGISTPFIPGREFSGEVIAIGSKVTSVSIGQRIMAENTTGALAELAVCAEHKAFMIPESMSYEQAACFQVAYGTAYHSLVDRGRIKLGESVAVLGASGGVGSACIQIAKLFTDKIIACAGDESKKEHCKAMGASHFINYSSQDLKSELKVNTENQGVDVLCDMVGGLYSESAFRAMAWNGRHLVIGFANGKIPSIPLNLPLLKGASLTGVFWSTFAEKFPERFRQNTETLLDLFEKEELKPVIHKIYSFSKTLQAYKDITERRARGKVCVKMEH